MEHNIQVQTLPSGDLQVRLEVPMTGAQLVEKLGISRERTRRWRSWKTVSRWQTAAGCWKAVW